MKSGLKAGVSTYAAMKSGLKDSILSQPMPRSWNASPVSIVSTYAAMKSGLKASTNMHKNIRQSLNLCRDEKRTESAPSLKSDFKRISTVSTYAAMKSGLKDFYGNFRPVSSGVSTYAAMKSGLKGNDRQRIDPFTRLNLCRDEKRTESQVIKCRGIVRPQHRLNLCRDEKRTESY